MRLPSLFKQRNPAKDRSTASSSIRQPWPSCVEQPRTHSFRDTPATDSKCTAELISSSPAKTSLLSMINDSGDEADAMESLIRGVRSSERLFFSPEKSNSLLDTATEQKRSNTDKNRTSTSTLMSMKSQNPYMDFRTSMEEMVAAHDLRDWELLEELLSCYLMVNEKRNHIYIVRAFADLLVSLRMVGQSSSGCCSSSVVSDSFVTSCSSPLHFSSSTAGTSCSSSLTPAEVSVGTASKDVDKNSSLVDA